MIHPIPRKIIKNKPLNTPACFSFAGDETDFVKYLFEKNGICVCDNGYIIEIKVTDSEKTSYINELSRLTDEKYFITLCENGALIEASTKKGVFRAVNTFVKLTLNGELFTGEIEDYPLFSKRGYIEGFYGKTWAHEKRLSVMELMAENGMNTYYYAPKDDVYHREKWDVLYPEKELSEIKELIDFASSNYLDFNWCVGPGLSYCYTSDTDFNKLTNKFLQLYNVGVKNFGLLLDDILWEFQYESDSEKYESIVYAHIDLVNKVYDALKKIDENIHLTVCPTQYSGDGKAFYISKFGSSIPSDVSLFWTGAEICSRVLTCREADELFMSSCHKPLYWDNFPVNDCEMFQEMHLGGLEGRDKELYLHSEGLISNVMEYAECSKIPLLTVCDYLWNPIAYDKEKSLKNAQKTVLGEKAELFSYFADHLGVSCLSKYSSAYMSDTLYRVFFLYNKGEKEDALSLLKEYKDRCRDCFNMLCDMTVPLFFELKKWNEKFGKACDLLDLIYACLENPCNENKNSLNIKLDEYNSDAVILTGFCLREAAEKTLKV